MKIVILLSDKRINRISEIASNCALVILASLVLPVFTGASLDPLIVISGTFMAFTFIAFSIKIL